MKTNDLRIGNYLKRNNKIVKVNGLSRNEVKYTDNDKGEIVYDIMFFQPIELTEELLVKIGFEKYDEAMNIYAFENERAIVVYVLDRKLLKIEGVENGVLIDRNIRLNNVEHLHQLQNAYYCLTNEELNIEL